MEAGSEERFEVWRGRRRRLAGTWDDLLGAARAGRIRHSDRLAVSGSPDRLPPHAVPALLRLVPGAEEAGYRRALRALAVFDALAGALLLAGAGAALATGAVEVRLVLGALILFVGMFVAPIFPLRRRVRQLAGLRAQGVVPGVNARRTTGDPGLDALLRRKPAMVRAVTAAVVASSVLGFVVPGWPEALAKVSERILAGEWWRLWTVALVHGGIAHLAFNALALWDLGGLAEAFYGRARLGAVLFLGTGFATVASVLRSDVDSVGASGGVFAIVGAMLVFGLRARGLLPEPVRRRLVLDMLWVVVVNVAFGLAVPYVDNAAHLGGLGAGALVGAILGPDPGLRRLLGAGRA
ncbi:MAG TPA: rhomboid family intramembrane serine protease [Anaeromyxobacteraceae bacterium]|nr:rhomboid family intramembrane serine protease [Anaeromyxobacteraceae bacterium]